MLRALSMSLAGLLVTVAGCHELFLATVRAMPVPIT